LIEKFEKIVYKVLPQPAKLALIRFDEMRADAKRKSKEAIIVRMTPHPMLNFSVHLADHCNLKCWGCDHFSPLASERFSDLKEFESDFRRLSELTGGKATFIKLMGGEPLLHPQINEFLPVARKYFPEAEIKIVTNGTLLLQKDLSFWKACRENSISVAVTKYPIKVDYQQIQKKAMLAGVSFEFFSTSGYYQKTSYHIPFDISGNQDARKNFSICFHANVCIHLERGKLFTCTIAPNVQHFNKYFGLNLALTENDYIDIYKAKSAREILEFLSKPIPFCRYCNVEKRTFGHPWERSKKEISEWTVPLSK
jgi:hypothetical protein